MIAIYRTQNLLPNEKKWLKSLLDTKLGLALGIDVNVYDTVSDTLSAKVGVSLGGDSRSQLINAPLESTVSCRGNAEDFGGVTVITTWDVADVIRDPSNLLRDFLADLLKAKVYLYGLGNRNTGFINMVQLGGPDAAPDQYSVEGYEQFVSAFQASV